MAPEGRMTKHLDGQPPQIPPMTHDTVSTNKSGGLLHTKKRTNACQIDDECRLEDNAQLLLLNGHLHLFQNASDLSPEAGGTHF